MTDPCLLCHRPLHPTETRTCVACVGRTRRQLRDIATLHALLPAFLGHPAGPALGTVHAPTAEPPLPGGDALVMLGPGAPRGDGQPSDPPAVAFELWQWSLDWAETRGEATPCTPVEATVPWLSRRTGWAAAHHDAFDEFAGDVDRIVRRLEAVTHSSMRPVPGPHCLDCPDVRLVRELGTEVHTCPRCRRRYNPVEFWLAVRADMEAERDRGAMWVTLVEAARAAGRTHWTLRTWVNRGVVSGACRVTDQSVLVWLPDVMDATAATHRRLPNGLKTEAAC